ncbi:MAG: hypothetical protein ACLUOF_12020 [Ruminococcus sp.]
MGGFFRSKKFRIILCIVALLIGMMLYAVTRDGYTLPTTGFLGTVLNPIRSVSNSISSGVQDTMDVFTKSKEYQTENEELRQRVAELEPDWTMTRRNRIWRICPSSWASKRITRTTSSPTPAPSSAMSKTTRSTAFILTGAAMTASPFTIRL